MDDGIRDNIACKDNLFIILCFFPKVINYILLLVSLCDDVFIMVMFFIVTTVLFLLLMVFLH